MKKIIISFMLGQAVQLVLLWIGQGITYASNLWGFCFGLGAVVIVALCIGAAGSLIELAAQEPADEETAPLPDGLEVKNDSLKWAEARKK